MIEQTTGRFRGAESTTAVVVQADDALVLDGTTASLAATGRVEVLPEERMAEADMVVVITADVTRGTLQALSRIRETTVGRAQILLVADRVSEPQLRFAAGHGVVAFLMRSRTSSSQLLAAVMESHCGEPVPSGRRLNTLRDQLRNSRNGAMPEEPLPAGLMAREIDVLRMLAEGMDVMQIAAELTYSERLIKSVIHSVVKRFGLRNRTHAVAHAIRTGIL
ncbi:helix-turn-helix transcriptional regulator [Streptomyces bauhiniae]|uniref:helix-turn-helix transcriptional regulator n=1 Tax=Streptomyces bauhiniae TaxID=2340725 RepID=UPI0035DB1770